MSLILQYLFLLHQTFLQTRDIVSESDENLSCLQVEQECRESLAQIEKTYYHLKDEIRLTNAVADYRLKEDGTIEVL